MACGPGRAYEAAQIRRPADYVGFVAQQGPGLPRPWRPKHTVNYVGVAASHFKGRLALTASRVAIFMASWSPGRPRVPMP